MESVTNTFKRKVGNDLHNNIVSRPLEKSKSEAQLHTVVPINNNRTQIGAQYLHHKDQTVPKGMNESELAVLVRDLCKGYEKNGPRILNNFCMNVRKGTIYGLLGASGSGKTTALTAISGLTKWESGEVLVFGEKPGTKESGIPGKGLGYVPQDIALYDHLSIKENIQYYGRLYGMSEADILEQWSFLVNLLQLPTEFKLATNLSGGQKRRTSLALALVHMPRLLILDEPTVGLDPLLRISVWKHLFNLVQTQGTTIIITTHYIEESKHSHTIGVMRHGRLLVEDSPSVLMTQFKTDILEDVVLKLCWADTKRAIRNAPPASSLQGATNAIGRTSDNKETTADSDDGDSGTGTDNDINDDVGRASTSDSGDQSTAGSTIVSTSGSNNANANERNVPRKINSGKVKPPLVRSASSELCGTLFQSKWKPELDGVVIDGNCSLRGSYNQISEFDSFPPINTTQHEAALKHSSRKVSTVGPKQWLADAMMFTQRVAAFCCVIFLSMIRHPVFCLAALVLPAAEVLLTVSSIGKEPIGLAMAVINDEMPTWQTQCAVNSTMNPTSMSALAVTHEEEKLPCNFNELSCKYLGLLGQEKILNMIPYNSIEDAVSDVHNGHIWGYIHFSHNYSQHMIDRLAFKVFAEEKTINGSSISVRMDMSQYLGSIIILQHLFDGLQGYVAQLIDSCDLGARQAEIPLHYRTPVYGTLEDKYHNYIIPGVLANIMFMMPFAISALVFIVDLKRGTLGRARVAGLTTLELMTAYCVTQGTMVMGQIVMCTLCLRLGFDFDIVGSTGLWVAIAFLLGMCGQAFGIFFGIITRDEIEALIAALFILPSMLMFGGVLWPLDCMAPQWKYLGSTLPTTLITESLRSTATRGVDITHALMWPGIAITTGWLIVFWIAAAIAFKIFIK